MNYNIYRGSTTSALAGFQTGTLSWSNWKFGKKKFVGRKTREPGEKSSEQSKNQQQTQPTYGIRPDCHHIGDHEIER